MKKNLIKIFGILVLVVLQLSFFSKFSFFSSIPNLIFILSIVLLLRGFLQDSFLVAALGGLFLDLASPLRFGIYTFLLMAILLFVNFVILKRLPPPNPLVIFLLMVGAFLVFDSIIFGIVRTMPGWQIIFDALINGLWGILIYFLLGKILKPKGEIQFS